MMMTKCEPAPHIVMLHKAYPPWVGGVERHIRDVSEALVERGWRVTALVCNDARFETREWRGGVRVIRVPRWGSVLSQPLTTRYAHWLKRLKPDIVHAHTPFPLAWLMVRRVPKSTPVICTWHSDIVRQKAIMPLLRPFELGFLKRCNQIVATSPRLIEFSRALRPVKDRCVSIPLSLPPCGHNKLSNAIAFSETQPEHAKPTLLFVGRLVGYKGLKYLIQAMKSLDAHLLIAGDGPLRGVLQTQVERAGLADRISFLGYVDDETKRSLYRAADVFVLPSVSANEAFGYVLLEAMSEGLPVVTCDLPTGVSYVNQHQQTGLIVPPKNADALREAIQLLISDISLRREYGAAARRRVESEFDFNRTLDSLEAVYRQSLPG
ncbi:MAG: glycosyltransferase [Candidatus Hinthialibacter antarcticus]|nr:glycosyltransferase [Candidatus Hinthialibacter antarcticus]